MGNYDVFVSYIPLVIIVIGVTGNTTAFLIFIFHKQLNTISSMRYLSFISITDTLSLFVWNLNHFLKPNFNIEIESLSMFNCKFLPFMQYASLQCSGLLYSMLSVDRYFTIIALPGSFASKLPFGTVKCATIWSFSIVFIIILLNLHLVIFMGVYETVKINTSIAVVVDYNSSTNETIIVEESYIKLVCFKSTFYYMSPMWDVVNLVVYNFIPFFIMLVFNLLLISKTFTLNRHVKSNQQNASVNRRKQRLTISLLIITFLFIVITLPSTILFGFFLAPMKATALGRAILTTVDSITFLQHCMIFLTCFLTNSKFRHVVKDLFCCNRRIPNLKSQSNGSALY